MQIIITGGAGFLGQLLAKKLLNSALAFDELVLVDIILPQNQSRDTRIKCLQADLSETDVAENIISTKTIIIFHLAAIVSSHAEKDFDLGWKVNVDCTKNLLEACRNINPSIRFVFASSCAVFGGDLPEIVLDQTAITPQSSYGTQKAISELMVNDYTRKGFLDGTVLRLPTVCIRPGKPNLAASSFVSSIIREPMNGENATCPVPTGTAVWISSPDIIVENFIYAATLQKENLSVNCNINLPGIKITVNEMIVCLQKQIQPNIINFINFEVDLAINKIVSTWPTMIDNTKALKLGFKVDGDFDGFILQYLQQTKALN
jgi:D-erythronate 2-dehydrogenase